MKKAILIVLVAASAFALSGERASAAVIGKSATTSANLVGWWTFDEGTSTTAGDFSGNGHRGTLTNISSPPTATSGWASGKRGRALALDNVDDYVVVADNPLLDFGASQDFTMSLFQTKNSNTARVPIEKRGSGLVGYMLAEEYPSAGQVTLFFNDGGSQKTYTFAGANASLSQFPLGTWFHVAVVIRRSINTVYLYLNGVQVSSVDITATSGSVDSDSAFYIGYDAGGVKFNGKIDDVRMYRKALSAGEIKVVYQSGEVVRKSSDKTGLLGHWSFDEGTSTFAGDLSGNGYTGTLGSGQTWTAGKRGGAVNFDAVDDVVTTNYSAGDQANWTMMAWVYDTKNNGGYRAIIQTNVASDDALYIYPAGTLGYWPCSTAGVVPPNQWVFVTATYEEGVGFKYYINGVLAGTSGTCADANDWDFLKFGGHSAGDSERWGGKMDDIRIYTRVLAASEIESIYRSNQTKINAPQDTKLTSGLVGYWTFNGKDVTTTSVWDISGRGNNGIISGAVPAVGKNGQAFRFDGNDSISLSAVNPASFVSVAGWFKRSGPSTNTHHIVFMQDTQIEISIPESTGQLRTGVSTVTLGRQVFDSGSGLTDGEWHFVGLTYDGANLRSYIDGVQTANNVVTGSLSTGGTTAIGSFAGSYFANGLIDEVRVYDRALSAAQMKQLYLMGK